MIDPNVLYMAGGVLAGVAGLKIVEGLVSKVFLTDNVSRAEFEVFKQRREELATKEDFKQFRLECTTNRTSCLSCIAAMKEKQLTLRETLPRDFVQKIDFRIEMREVKDWLESISEKLDEVIKGAFLDRKHIQDVEDKG